MSDIRINIQSSIRIGGSAVLYFDPLSISGSNNDADVVFITHDHSDHFSPRDIEKVIKKDTKFVIPASLKNNVGKMGIADDNIICMEPNMSKDIEVNSTSIHIEAVYAYNKIKPFHPKRNKWVGYVVTMDGESYYVAGDTDALDENLSVKCDVALVPIGGHFTMDYKDAARWINKLKPKKVIPIHYGSIVGDASYGEKFKELIDTGIEVELLLS
ncbi:MAG: MBL fold metallo-hydrolase [Lachnospiraceae bacterium]|nr:MBL fold metallo-hydrolase [Lachnospiraceae bacterium]